ncbi:MAG: hypothetical protein HDT39_09100 [Lachnospiraceae bacterium]|nr:hypothetical protein [Lachnospiraceae bacterium]
MEKFRTKSMRYLAFALIAAMISVFGLGAWEGVKAIAAEEEDEVVAPASFISADDTVVTDFIFYTTDNASKKVPAANKWIKTNGGKVDVSNLTKGKTLYFANSTTPSLDEIVAVVVPASPVLSTAKYDAKGETLDKKFVFQTTVKVVDGKKTKSQKVDVPKARIEIKVNDNSTWKPFVEAITDGTLQALQKEGATVYARIAPTNTEIEYDEDTRTCTFVDAGISEDEDTSIENGENITRYGVAKTFKIAKKSAGPAVKVDYANHSITIKKGQSYIKTNDEYAIDEDNWKDVTDKNGEKVYFNSVTDTEYYGVKTATSLTTYLLIPSAVPFAATNSSVTIQGGNGEAATLAVTANVEEAVAKATKVAYQYAIVDLKGVHKDLIKDGVFDYEKSLSFTAKTDKITWKNVSVTIKKEETTGTATASIPWKSVDGKQVLVRKAAAGTEFSSQVVVFNAPTGDGLASYGDDAAVNCWSMLTQANYGSGFSGDNTDMEFCANISNAVYDAKANTITINVVAGDAAKVEDVENLTLKVGKTEYPLAGAVTGKAEDVEARVGNTMITTKNYVVTIDLSKVDKFPTADANKVTIIVPAGYAANEAGVATAAKTINVTVDNKAPKVTKAPVFKNGTVTITVDDAKLVVPADAKIEAKDADDNEVIVFTEIKFNSKSKTITAKYEVKIKSEEKVTLTLDGIADAAGNKIDASALENLTNPEYVKPSEEETTPEVGE